MNQNPAVRMASVSYRHDLGFYLSFKLFCQVAFQGGEM